MNRRSAWMFEEHESRTLGREAQVLSTAVARAWAQFFKSGLGRVLRRVDRWLGRMAS